MNKIFLLSKTERELYFRTAAETLNISFDIIEKDYWVVWTLERLFELEDLKTHLTFKGGTSLSKVFGIIDRFSEDIDLSIERFFLGFDENNDPEKAPSRKKQQLVLENLSKACSEYVLEKMHPDLSANIAHNLGTTFGWQLTIDGGDSDAQTLLFEYPCIAPGGGYIRPVVKIEMGARSEHWPVSEHRIQSYVKDALKDKITEAAVLEFNELASSG